MFFFVGDSTGFIRVFHEFSACCPRVLPVVIEIEPLWGSGIICFIFLGFPLVFHGFYPWLLMLNPFGVRELFALYSMGFPLVFHGFYPWLLMLNPFGVQELLLRFLPARTALFLQVGERLQRHDRGELIKIEIADSLTQGVVFNLKK